MGPISPTYEDGGSVKIGCMIKGELLEDGSLIARRCLKAMPFKDNREGHEHAQALCSAAGSIGIPCQSTEDGKQGHGY